VAALRPITWKRALAATWLGSVVVLAVAAPYLPLPFPPAAPDLAHPLLPPFRLAQHWLGTDGQGRDVLANLVFGARTAVAFTLPAAALAAMLGALLGGAAGFWHNRARLPLPYWLVAAGLGWWGLSLPADRAGLAVAVLAAGWQIAAGALPSLRAATPALRLPLDALVLGAIALLGSVPRLVLVLTLGGAGLQPAALLALLVLSSWPESARLVRAEMLRVRSLPFMAAAEALGLPAQRRWWRHALPHALHPLRAAFPMSLAALVGLENTLSFLGIGFAPTTPSWGRLLGSVRLAPTAWWLAVFPALILIISIISLRTFARGLTK